jgi:hypothetical protein
MSETVTLSDEDTEKIDSFIREMWDAGKSTKMGNGSFSDFKRAYKRGKGAEVAVSRFLDEGGVNTSVDFDVYHGGDDGDLKPLRAEVKQAPDYGKWVAIPESKFEQIPDDDLIIQVRTHAPDEFEVVGWCYQDDLCLIEEGEKKFTQFEANKCLPMNELRTDWREFVEVASDGKQSYNPFTFSA